MGIEVDWDLFKKLSALRNDIEHYYSAKSKKEVLEIISGAFVLIRDFITDILGEEPSALLGYKCWSVLTTSDEVFKKERADCLEKILEVDWPAVVEDKLEMVHCSNCGSSLVVPDIASGNIYDMDFVCKACGRETSGGETLEYLLDLVFGFDMHVAKKEGVDGPLDTCPECSQLTYFYEEERCLCCGYEKEYAECNICGEQLTLDEQDLDGMCSYHAHVLSKDDLR